MTDVAQLSCTMTGEVFQPIRLYYKVHSEAGVLGAFRRLECMEPDIGGNRWTWLYDDEAKKLKFERSYSLLPPEVRPIVLGSFYPGVHGHRFLDIGSVERAVHAVQFFSRHIKKAVAEVEYAALYNGIFSPLNHPGPCFDKLFSGVDASKIDARQEERLQRTIASASLPREFELVEAFRVSSVALEQLRSGLEMRRLVALKRWSGDPDFCFADLVNEITGAL